jgi:hypothetical protein
MRDFYHECNPQLVLLALPAMSVVEPSSVEVSDVEVSAIRNPQSDDLQRFSDPIFHGSRRIDHFRDP